MPHSRASIQSRPFLQADSPGQEHESSTGAWTRHCNGGTAPALTGEDLTAARLQQIAAAAKDIPLGTTVMSDKPMSLAQLQFKYHQAANAPTHPALFLQLLEAFRIYDLRHANEGHMDISAETMLARIDDNALRVMAYASRGMQSGDFDKLLASSFKSGLTDPISTALPSMLTFGASSFISAIHGPWAGLAGMLVFATGKPFVAGAIQPAIVSLGDNLRGRNGPTVLSKGEVNDEVWLETAARTLEGMDKSTKDAIEKFDEMVGTAMSLAGFDARDLAKHDGVERFLANVSDERRTAMCEAFDAVDQALRKSAPQTLDVLHAVEQASRPSLFEQYEMTLKAKLASERQVIGNSMQRIGRPLRPMAGTLTTVLSGLKADERPARMAAWADRPDRLEGKNRLASPAISTGYTAGISLLQSVLAGLDERNKQAFNIKAVIMFYDAFTPEGKRRYEAGEPLDPDLHVDQVKLRGAFTSISEYMVEATRQNLNQRRKDLAACIIAKGYVLDELPERTSHIADRPMRDMIERYKAMIDDLAAVDRGIQEGSRDFLTALPDREVKRAFQECITGGVKHVWENMTKVKYAKEGELKAQWIQKVSTDVSMFGLTGQFTPSVANRLAAAICGGSGKVPNTVVGLLGLYNLAAAFIGAQSQSAAINAKNNFRESRAPRPTATQTFFRGVMAPVAQTRTEIFSTRALKSSGQTLYNGRQLVNSSLARGMREEGLRRRGNAGQHELEDPDRTGIVKPGTIP